MRITTILLATTLAVGLSTAAFAAKKKAAPANPNQHGINLVNKGAEQFLVPFGLAPREAAAPAKKKKVAKKSKKKKAAKKGSKKKRG